MVGCARDANTATPTTSRLLEGVGALHVNTTPPNAHILLDGRGRGTTPVVLDLSPGTYTLRLERAGYEPVTVQVHMEAGQTQLVEERLQDVAPPVVALGPLALHVTAGEGLKVVASAQDNEGVAYMRLLLDGEPAAEASEGALRHNLDTRTLAQGEHALIVEAGDPEGNVGTAEAVFRVIGPPSEPQETLSPERTAAGEAGSAPEDDVPTGVSEATPGVSEATPTSEAAPTSRPQETVRAWWDQVTISTYAYEQALYTDPEAVGHPYPLLRRELVGPPEPKAYRVLKVSNEYLELTFLPDLGGRLYQARFLPTGQDLFYNNRVIKPSPWGPVDQGWWLAVGGMEWCLPVDEHGYLSAQPWETRVLNLRDGGVTVSISATEESRNIMARVDVTLHPGEAVFAVRTALHNPDETPKELQYWVNAMLSPGGHGIGPSLRIAVPAQSVVVHSTGDPTLPGANSQLTWPVYQGRDLSRYGAWRNWLGFFAPSLSEPYTAIYDEATEIGMVRIFPSAARGAKLFGFGDEFGDEGVYTDDSTQYIEMWGGLTPTFWDYAVLDPGATVSWEEQWYVISRSGVPAVATREVAVAAEWDVGHVELTVTSPMAGEWMAQLLANGTEVAGERCAVRPDVPCRVHLDAGGAAPESSNVALSVRLFDLAGNVVTSLEP